MKNMRKYLKENGVIVALVIVFLIAIGISFVVKNVFFTTASNAAYGERLKGIEKVKITKSEKESVNKSLTADAAVKSVKVVVQGKIVNTIITINDDVGADTAKALGAKVLESFSDEEKAFYDFQAFIKKENGQNDFPIIGYKHNNSSEFVWTKDRVAS